MFEEFLNNIVAEHICHQLNRVRVYFSENLVFFVAVSRLKLLLNEPGAMLIATKFYNMVVDILRHISNVLNATLIWALL